MHAVSVLKRLSEFEYFCFKIACVESISVGFRGKELPLFLILALAPISRGQNTVPVPFLGLSLLPNPTETLAMQANLDKIISKYMRRFPTV